MFEPRAAVAVTVRPASWQDDRDDLMDIRLRVFVEEQGIPESEEMDEADPTCRHALAVAPTGELAGTGRLRFRGRRCT